ncbi:urease accessory protein UreE [Sphingobium indicum IP26]|uniref:Urease accessory protein UreE n=1 Tax=Sphingobium indicum F2 TaxID=1450518 RepID=A0A8E0WVE5_9SPHN|nr:urease accessory protein UreE [Sphingobium indicum IP26]KER37890.1 urease accessory protein UreE [Sphingobium indicum F2]
MNRILSIIPQARDGVDGPWADSVRLDHDLRNRRRMVYTTQGGRGILLDMPRAVHLRDGDGLALDSGELVRVEAAPEPLIEITAPDMPLLLRLAWHLGNRHLPTQLLGDRMRIRHDHVIAEMIEGLGGRCEHVLAPFDPEGGAYEGVGHGRHHHDGGDHDRHEHAHG